MPRWPKRPERPTRCRYVSLFLGKSKLMTTLTACRCLEQGGWVGGWVSPVRRLRYRAAHWGLALAARACIQPGIPPRQSALCGTRRGTVHCSPHLDVDAAREEVRGDEVAAVAVAEVVEHAVAVGLRGTGMKQAESARLPWLAAVGHWSGMRGAAARSTARCPREMHTQAHIHLPTPRPATQEPPLPIPTWSILAWM